MIIKLMSLKHLTRRYLNIDNPHCEGMVSQIYPPELQLKKLKCFRYGSPLFGFIYYIYISSGFVSSKIYDKRDDFEIVTFPFLNVTFSVVPFMEYTFYNL